MSQVQIEQVLVVPTQKFHDLGYFQGFSSDVDSYFSELLSPACTSYRPRDEMEQDPSFKQLIPYCIFTINDPAQGRTIFTYTRGKGQGEQRLHAKQSIGIGGHISSDDATDETDGSPYERGMQRELAEEVRIDSPYQQRMAGLINDDETEVGRVHLGVVHVFELERPAVTPMELEIENTGFRPLAEIRDNKEHFETWSQICFQALFSSEIS